MKLPSEENNVMMRKTAFLLAAIIDSIVASSKVDCPSQFFSEYGSISILRCDLPGFPESVFWYKVPEQGPFISRENEAVSGPGYDSGEFDITPEGALVIHEVRLEHNRELKVFAHYEEWENDFSQMINVTVYVKPNQSFPRIDVCEDDNVCLVTIEKETTLMCSVKDSRPDARLSWFRKNERDTTPLTFEREENEAGITVSSFAYTTVIIEEQHLLELIVCVSESPAPLMELTSSSVLLEQMIEDVTSMPEEPLSVQIGENVVLDINIEDPFAVVWKKKSSPRKYETIGYSVEGLSVVRDNFQITKKGDLRIEHFVLNNEGEYVCIYATSTTHAFKRVYAQVVILPTPPYPKILGCKHRHSCEIDVPLDGFLTCSLEGVRPLLNLQWVYNGERKLPILFGSPETLVQDDDISFHLVLITPFSIKMSTSETEINVSCQAVHSIEGMPYMESTAILRTPEYYRTNGDSDSNVRIALYVILPILFLVVIVVVCLIVALLIKRRRKIKKKKKKMEQLRQSEQRGMFTWFWEWYYSYR